MDPNPHGWQTNSYSHGHAEGQRDMDQDQAPPMLYDDGTNNGHVPAVNNGIDYGQNMAYSSGDIQIVQPLSYQSNSNDDDPYQHMGRGPGLYSASPAPHGSWNGYAPQAHATVGHNEAFLTGDGRADIVAHGQETSPQTNTIQHTYSQSPSAFGRIVHQQAYQQPFDGYSLQGQHLVQNHPSPRPNLSPHPQYPVLDRQVTGRSTPTGYRPPINRQSEGDYPLSLLESPGTKHMASSYTSVGFQSPHQQPAVTRQQMQQVQGPPITRPQSITPNAATGLPTATITGNYGQQQMMSAWNHQASGEAGLTPGLPSQPAVPAGLSAAVPTPGWQQVQGCPHLLIQSVPTAVKRSRRTRAREQFTAEKNTYITPLLPGRQDPLPCEIKRDYLELKKKLTPELAPNEHLYIEQRLHVLKNSYLARTGTIINEDEDALATTETARSAAKRRNTNDSSDQSLTSDSSDDENEVDGQVRKIMASGPPEDSVKRIEYDTIKIIWRDPKTAQDDQAAIRQDVLETTRAYTNYVLKLWGDVKDVRLQLDKAQNKDERRESQEALVQKSLLMRTAIETANEHGDPHIMRNMGIDSRLMVILSNAWRSQLSAKDYNSPFAKSILKFWSHITTVDQAFLSDKLKLDRVRVKYYDDLDDEGKKHLDKFFSNAAQNTEKQQNASPRTKQSDTPVVKKKVLTTTKSSEPLNKSSALKTKTPLKKPATIPEVKKIQPTDYSGLGSARKVSSNGTGKSNMTGSPAKRLRDDDSESRAPKKVAVEGATGAPSATKTSATTVTNPPATQNQTTVTTAAPARARLAGSMLLNKARAQAKVQPKKTEALQSSRSTISGLLDEIAKPVEKPKPREEPIQAPETASEKARRLRKEARKNLRVTWKPEEELAEYRIFEHDSAEDEGRVSSMIRDAHDYRSEGQAHKMNVQMNEDMDEDDEDEDGKSNEIEIRQWQEPTAIDFNVIAAEQRAKTAITRGGLGELQTEQKKIMDDYERRELMAIYTTVSEIPDTPRSPPSTKVTEDPSRAKIVPFLPTENPASHETNRRWAESKQFGPVQSQYLALQRHGLWPPNARPTHSGVSDMSNPTPPTKDGHAPRAMTQDERETEVLKILQSDKVRNWINPDPYDPANPRTQRRYDYPDPQVQAAANNIEDIVAQLKGKPYPPTEPPEWLKSNADRVKEWHTGRNNEIAAKAKKEANERAARFAQEYARKMADGTRTSQTQAQGSLYAPQYQAPAQQQPQPQAQPQIPEQYAAIWQQVQALQNNQPSQPAAAAQPSTDINALLAALSHQPSQQPTTVTQPQPDNSLSNLLAVLGQSNQAAPAPPSQVSDHARWQLWAQQQAQAQSQVQQPQQQKPATQAQSYGYDSNMYDDSHHQSYGSREQQQDHQFSSQGAQRYQQRGDGGNDRGGGNRKDFYHVNKDQKGINRALIGTKPCVFWAKGQCAKGDKCTFRHDPNDLK